MASLIGLLLATLPLLLLLEVSLALGQECPWAPVKALGAGGKDKPWTSCWVPQGAAAHGVVGSNFAAFL